jgi:chromate transporter
MVVAFVGFLGGWSGQLPVPESMVAAGIAGAFVATFFTFLPSFLFILIGGPAVEASREDIKFTAPLTGITAAVVSWASRRPEIRKTSRPIGFADRRQ